MNANKNLKKIAEAYSVLSDDLKRKQYDMYGNTGFNSNFDMNVSPFDIFNEIFGSNCPMPGVVFVAKGNVGINLVKNTNFKPKPIVEHLFLELEDVYNGSLKNITYRRLINDNGKLSKIEANKTINIPIGVQQDEIFELENLGNESIEGMKGDLIVKVKINEHKLYKRENNDLYFDKELLLSEALCGFKFILKCLNGKKKLIHYTQDSVVGENTIHLIKNEGLPFKEDNNKKGDLYITYRIKYPNNLDSQRKLLLKRILPIRTNLSKSVDGLEKLNVKILNNHDEKINCDISNYENIPLNEMDININSNLPPLPPLPPIFQNLGKLGLDLGLNDNTSKNGSPGECIQQ